MFPYRYHPSIHRILHSLTKEFGAKTKSFNKSASQPNTFTHFMRNKRINGLKEVQENYAVADEDLQYLGQTMGSLSFKESSTSYDVEIPENGDLMAARVRQTGQLLKDTTLANYLMQSKNSELLNFIMNNHPNVVHTMGICVAEQLLSKSGSPRLETIEGGFSDLIARIVSTLSSMTNVELKLNQRVKSIDQSGGNFLVKTINSSCKSDQDYEGHKVIYACGIQGLEYIEFPRWAGIRELTANVRKIQGFKLFLTYKRAWWEQYGLHTGAVVSDLPNRTTMVFGEEGKTATHATILVAYTNRNLQILESLDYKDLERFKNEEGEIPEEQTPSQMLVEFMQGQLKLILG